MSDREQLEKLIQEYGRSMYKAGFRVGVMIEEGIDLSDSERKPGDVFNKISNLINAM